MATRRAAVLTGFAVAVLAPRRLSAQSPAIRINATLNDPFLQPYFAQTIGAFDRAGLTVQIQSLTTFAGLQGVIGGSIDIAVSDLLQIANAHSRGVDIVVIAAGAHYDVTAPTIALIVKSDSPIRATRDLVGKTISVPALNSTVSIAVEQWLSNNGTDPLTVRLVEVPLSEANPALQRGTVDAAMSGEPFLTEGRGTYRVLGYPFGSVANQFYTGIWCAMRSYVDANAALTRKVIDALYEGGRWANTHRAESSVVEARLTQIPIERVSTMARNRYSFSLDPHLAQPLLDVAYRWKVLTKPVVATDLFWK